MVQPYLTLVNILNHSVTVVSYSPHEIFNGSMIGEFHKTCNFCSFRLMYLKNKPLLLKPLKPWIVIWVCEIWKLLVIETAWKNKIKFYYFNLSLTSKINIHEVLESDLDHAGVKQIFKSPSVQFEILFCSWK